jgi:hypothetical protein
LEVCQQKKDFTETLQHQHFSFTFALHPEPERVPTGQPKPRWQNDAGMFANNHWTPPKPSCLLTFRMPHILPSKTTDMTPNTLDPIHPNEAEFNGFISKFEGFSNEALVKEHNQLTATGMFAVGSQMRFALALHRVMKSRFPAELDGQNPAFPLNLKTTFQLVNGELKAYPKLT